MSRGLTLNLLASGLTILATIAFLGATAVGNGAPVDVPAESGTRPVVRAFYDAINTGLRSGDPTALEAVVAPNFVMHGAGSLCLRIALGWHATLSPSPPSPRPCASRLRNWRWLAITRSCTWRGRPVPVRPFSGCR